MKGFLFTSFFFALIQVSAQYDSARYYADIEKLERKLTYTYFNVDEHIWWINTFTYDKESQVARFKSTSTKNPQKLLGKKYTERSIRFENLNPYHIVVEPVEENLGFLVKGSYVEMETVKHKTLIVKTINGVPGTPQSYIYFPVPKYLQDSVSTFTDTLVATLQRVSQFASNLHNKGDKDKNEEVIFETLLGEHVSGDLKRFTEQHSEHVISFEEYVDRHKIRDGFIGHDPTKDKYYEILIEENGEMVTHWYEVICLRKIFF